MNQADQNHIELKLVIPTNRNSINNTQTTPTSHSERTPLLYTSTLFNSSSSSSSLQLELPIPDLPASRTSQFLTHGSDFIIISAAGLLSILNGYLYFDPGKSALKNLLGDYIKNLDKDVVASLNNYIGMSGLLANTFLAVRSLINLLKYQEPIDFDKDVPFDLKAIVKNIATNFGKNIQKNWKNISAKAALTLLCELIIIPFSYKTLYQLFDKNQKPEDHEIVKELFIIPSNVIASIIYANAGLELPEKLKKLLLPTVDKKLWNDYHDIFFNLATANDYKQALIKAYNETLIAPALKFLHLQLEEIEKIITLNILIPQDEKLKVLLDKAKQLDKKYVSDTANNLRLKLPDNKQQGLQFLESIYLNNIDIYANYSKFVSEFLKRYIRDISNTIIASVDVIFKSEIEQLIANSNELMAKNDYFSGSIKLLSPNTSHAAVYRAIVNIKLRKNKEEFAKTLLKNAGYLEPSIVRITLRSGGLILSLATFSVFFAGMVAGRGMTRLIFGNGHTILEDIFRMTFGVFAFGGRLPIFINSLTNFADFTTKAIPYNIVTLYQNFNILMNKLINRISNRLQISSDKKASDAIISIANVILQVGLGAGILAGVFPSPLGYMGIVKSGLDEAGPFPWLANVIFTVLAGLGAGIVNLWAGLNLGITLTGILIEFADLSVRPLINKCLNKVNFNMSQDREFYHTNYRYMQKLMQQLAEKAENAIDDTLTSSTLTMDATPTTAIESFDDERDEYNTTYQF
jgi:hypothetical protein